MALRYFIRIPLVITLAACSGQRASTASSGSNSSPTNGSCGGANGTSVTSAPSLNLCAAGTASGVSGAGPFSWTCAGTGDGLNVSCLAPLLIAFLDKYSGLGATWGFSSFKLTSAYLGNWGTVQRQSDNATANIGFLANGRVDLASFNAFCANTNCYVKTLNDQVNGINASQATLAIMPRAIVNSNGVLAVCPQPGSTMKTSYNATVNTPKIHLFAVARAAYADSRWSQPDVATTVLTGTVTAGSSTISGINSLFGISTANGGGLPMQPGITDSAGLLPGACYISAASGNSATIAFTPGNLSPTGTLAGDTLTVTNSVLAGTWIVNGPASSTYYNSAYWGAGMGSAGSVGDWSGPRNGNVGYQSAFQDVIGNGMRGRYAVYDYDTSTTQLNFNGVSLGQLTGSTSDITYSTNVGMTLFSDTNGNEGVSQSCFETMVLFPATQASRTPMAELLMSQSGLSFPFAADTSDGFQMTGIYQPSFTSASDSVYGAHSIGPDAHGMTWNMQSGGYTWPSVAYAKNISNGGTLWRFIVQPGDSDINITGAERAEINAGVTVAPGQHFSIFYQFEFEQLPSQTGDWCATGQVHYDNVTAGANSPDIISIDCQNGQAQFITQKTSAGNPVDTNCGTAFALTPGTVYAVEIEGFWSINHTSDTLTIHAGPNGGTLNQVCNVGPGALWDNDTGAYLKAGLYRGYPWTNAGTVIEREMNLMFTTTQNAYSAYIISQPALPSHL